ncbi:uncharacterized protein LOC121385671 isoform X2 [Gigantopelta aegis]|uniref:uncharacterized protein LOC121385671 isoform X2 n=1 Tax=Gigantopelta aegis TaxID=1735272 RepID=UPI001B88CBF6|nr:uncharacterized protein LOC121385671 isoform X2 [Gigantopelta aegis]
MRSVWIYWIIIAGVFTHFAYGKLAHWRNITFDFLEDQYVNTTKMSWWDAAKSACEDGVLLPHFNISWNLFTAMDEMTYYWVGALEVYTPWKWTEDISLLFVIRGSLNVSDYSRITVHDNEPYRCYTKCKRGPVGLQGKYCYCLNRNIDTTTHVEEIRCPGSYEQFCGSESTMSVYNLDIPGSLPFLPTDYSTCGYFYGRYRRYYRLKFDKSCENDMYYACPESAFRITNSRKCYNEVCISRKKKKWQYAMKDCGNNLIKLTTNTTQTLKTLISQTASKWIGTHSKHWIGLERHVTRKWINDKPKPTTVSTSKPTTVRTTSTTMSTTTHTSFTEKSSLQSDQTGHPRSTQAIAGSTESQQQLSPKSGSSGIIAGVAVGIIALLVLAGVVVLIWMKRSKRFLFKSAKLDHQTRAASPVHATASVPNTYEQYDNNANNRIQYENVAYCAQPNTNALRGPIAVSSIDYNLAAADDTLQGPRDLADLPNGVRPRDDYELAGPDDAKPETAYAADSSSYACPGDYFELEGPGDSGPETDDYELEGPADTAEYAVVDSKIASEEYNSLHETQRDRNLDLNYSHIGAAELTGDLYDTTEPTPHGRTDNDMYSHIKGDRFEDEDMYNHTDGSDDLPEQYDPEYNHITTK